MTGKRAVVHVVMVESHVVTCIVSVKHPTCLCNQSIIISVYQKTDLIQSDVVLLTSTARPGWQGSGHT